MQLQDLQYELESLNEHLEFISADMATPEFEELPVYEQQSAFIQQNTMVTYQTVLGTRINLMTVRLTDATTEELGVVGE